MNWSGLISRGGLAALAIVMGACTSAQISLDYQPNSARVVPGPPEFSVGRMVNARNEGSYYLGTVRTPIGTPLEHVQTRIPVEEVVRNAFSHALNTRGMLASPAKSRYVVTGQILDLYCQQIVNPYGYARLRVSIVKSGSGQVLFSRIYAGERQGATYRPGSGSPVPMLRDLTSRALQDAVDRALDDPEMRSRLRAY